MSRNVAMDPSTAPQKTCDSAQDDNQFKDYEDFEDQDEPEICPECFGSGFVVICVDDICNSLSYCIHGDGEMIFSTCNGEGEV